MPRPTILIGYGAFGRDALQRLLATTAPRGVLPWEETQRGDTASSERQLRDFVLLHLRDPFASEPHEADYRDAGAGGEPELLVDLYRQIREVRPDGDGQRPDQALADATEAAYRTLLSSDAVQARGGTEAAAGLDVILLARPTTPAAVGQLDNLLKAVLERLHASPNLRRAVQGAQMLGCIEILDFENYWDAGRRHLREALINSTRDWEHRRRGQRPALDRMYLVDSRAGQGYRDDRARLEEIALFLEFLLLEGRRADLPFLFQQSGNPQPVAAAFGIRLMERSPELLSRIAAACFGRGWLRWLVGDENARFERPAERVRAALAPLRSGRLETLVGRDLLAERWRAGVDALVEGVMRVPAREAADWPLRAREELGRRRDALEMDLNRAVDGLMREVGKRYLGPRGEAIAQAVDADLHDPSAPVPLGSVLKEIDDAVSDLAARQRNERPPGAAADEGLSGMPALHQRFLALSGEWIGRQGRRLGRFWPLLAILLGAGLAPFAVELPAAVPEPDPLARPLHLLYRGAQWLASPAIMAVLLALLAWAMLHGLMQPAVRRRIDRARTFFLDPARGRLSGCIRAQGEPLRALLEQTRANLDSTLASEVGQLLGQVRERLEERRRELQWLRAQLGEFLRLHGQAAECGQTGGQPRRATGGVRYQVERKDDLDRMLRANPIEEARFRAHQPDLPRPFAGWSERFCDAFLDPFAFVDRLSRTYYRPFESEMTGIAGGAEQGMRLQELRAFLARPDFSPAFTFGAEIDAPDTRTFCLMPPVWRGVPRVEEELMNAGIVPDRIVEGRDPARVYLLSLRSGVPASCLGP